MRKYETFFIVDSDLPDEVVATLDEKVKSVVTANGGQVLSYVPWGKKKLAYEVNKRTRGLYILMEYTGGATLVAELERNMRLDERVLKFITVKLEDRFDPEKEALRKAAEAAPRPFSEEEGRVKPVVGDESEEDEEEEEGEEEGEED